MVSSASARANPENARTGFAVLDSAGEKIRAEQDSCIKRRDLSTCMQLNGKISRTCVAFAGLQIIPAGCVAPSTVAYVVTCILYKRIANPMVKLYNVQSTP